MEHHATFFLSAGRCGTQWLAAQLAAHYSDRAQVEHEPLDKRYEPRRMLDCYAAEARTPGHFPETEAHLARIAGRLQASDYIETGHPCWSSVPFLAGRLSGRVRVVHLVRHPVASAMSWLTQRAYEPPLLPHLAEKVLLSPFDAGAAFPEYRQRWRGLTPFEKCLYYWTEVNAFGLEHERRLGVPWLRLSFEELFEADALARLLDFLGFPERDAILSSRRDVVDRFRYLTGDLPRTDVVDAHPRAVEVARALGYAELRCDEAGLARRYLGLG